MFSSRRPGGPIFSFLNRFGVSSRLAGEGGWAAGGQIATVLAILISVRIMTELLAPEEFGRLALLLGIGVLTLGLVATPRLQAVMRYYPEQALAGRIGALRRAGIRLTGGLVLSAALVLAAGWMLAGPLFGEPWFSGPLIAALLVVDSLRALELSLFNAARRQRAAALIYAADAWARPGVAVLAVVLFGAHADAALAGYIAGSALVVAAMYMTMRLEGAARGRPRWKAGTAMRADEAALAAAIRRYALPLVPLAIFGWVSGVGDRYIIGGVVGLKEVGLYAAAYGLASRPFMVLSGILELTIRPALYNAVASGNMAHVARIKRAWVMTVAGSSAFGVLCFLFLSGWVGDLLLAAEYRSATALMPWIALGYALSGVSNVFSRFCYAFDDTRAVLFLTAAGTVMGVIIMVPAIYFYGLAGAAAAVPVQFGVELSLSVFLARRAERKFLMKLACASTKGTI